MTKYIFWVLLSQSLLSTFTIADDLLKELTENPKSYSYFAIGSEHINYKESISAGGRKL